ncbi:MAG TPA: PIN domain-containing protein [Verrucomicrobiae bacterium]|jgi:predicted nucleic acid-binding protein|nr:PIN domain-containing protein [Verrucomicrobiae bacterium]
MRIYADTSALLAWFNPVDEFATVVTSWCRERTPDFYWNALLRIELRHSLRRISGTYAAIAWQAYRASETSQRLKLGVHRFSDLLEWGDELSARHAKDSTAGTWDFIHIAAAQRVRAEIFITCDAAQAELARLAGLKIQLFR